MKNIEMLLAEISVEPTEEKLSESEKEFLKQMNRMRKHGDMKEYMHYMSIYVEIQSNKYNLDES